MHRKPTAAIVVLVLSIGVLPCGIIVNDPWLIKDVMNLDLP
jgi:hypothetical protein